MLTFLRIGRRPYLRMSLGLLPHLGPECGNLFWNIGGQVVPKTVGLTDW